MPIATEAVFRAHWLPVARALGLEWVPLFATGVPVAAADLAAVIEELTAFRQHLETTRPASWDAVIARADRLVAELERLQGDGTAEIFIG